MKVCFLAGTLARGGAERQLVYMLRALQQAGVSTRLLCLTKGEAFEKEINALNIRVDSVGSSPNKINRLFEVINNLRKHPVDILQSSHFYTNIYVGIAGRVLSIPNVGAIRNDLKSEILSHQWLGKYQLSLPKHLIANTELARHRAVENGILPDKIDFVRNVVEIEDKIERSINPLPLNILFVGRLVNQKRPDLFVKLALLMEKELPNCRLNFQIVGDGLLKPQLEIMADALKLQQNRVSFLGMQNDLSKIYRQASALVLTSEHEGTPNVLLEAMAYGVPVIATRVGGVPEIVDNTRGILVDFNDEKALVEAVTKLISNSDLRATLGARGREYVLKNHSLEYLKNRLSDIYSNLLAR